MKSCHTADPKEVKPPFSSCPRSFFDKQLLSRVLPLYLRERAELSSHFPPCPTPAAAQASPLPLLWHRRALPLVWFPGVVGGTGIGIIEHHP